MLPEIQLLCQFFDQLTNLILSFDLEAEKELNICQENVVNVTLLDAASCNFSVFLLFFTFFSVLSSFLFILLEFYTPTYYISCLLPQVS